MEVETIDDTLFASGYISEADYAPFKELLANNTLKRVVFINSPGGDLWTGMTLAKMMLPKELDTFAVGHCMSACSIMFLAGKNRQFAQGAAPIATMIGIHGAHYSDSKLVAPELQPQLYAYYKMRMGDQFDASVINDALYKLEEADGMLRLRDVSRNQPFDKDAYFCPSRSTIVSKCTRFNGKTALNLGVITNAEVIDLNLPEKFIPTFDFFGVRLTSKIENIDVVKMRAKQMCDLTFFSGTCLSKVNQEFEDISRHNEHRALALGADKVGYGFFSGRKGYAETIFPALYTCNHVPNNKKLCELAVIDSYETVSVYNASKQQTIKALEQIRAIPDLTGSWAREADDFSIKPISMVGPHDFSFGSPLKIDGIQTWSTQQLFAATKQGQVHLIDVAEPVPMMLPQAINLMKAGVFANTNEANLAIQTRLGDMLEAAFPNGKSTPMVFYCGGVNCPLSANAAIRARDLGYVNVIWYRGGLASWLEAKLPTVQKVPHAIVY